MTKRCFLSFLFFLSFSIHPTFADIDIDIEDITALLLDWRTTAQEKIGDQIFDAIGTQTFRINLNDDIDIAGKVRRRFFDNRDGSFSILDVLDVKGRVSFDTPVLTPPGINLGVGAEKGLRFAHVFTVDVKDKLAAYEKWKEERKKKSTWQRVYHVVSPRNWFGVKSFLTAVSHVLDEISIFLGVLSEDRARHASLWKEMSIFLETPFSANKFLEDTKVNELYSFTRYTGFFTSLGAGMPSGIATAIGVGVYIRGDHRITVLKTSPTTAKIKVQRAWSTTEIINSSGRLPLFDYKLSIFDFRIGLKFSKRPFDLTFSSTQANAFDQAYEYDMTTEDGKKAYELAMQSDFITSDLFALENRSVKKIFIKNTKSFSKREESNLDLLIWQKSNQLDVSEHWIKYNSDRTNLLQTMAQKNDGNRNILTHKDEMNFLIDGRVAIDQDGFGLDPYLSARIQFSSDDTSGYEIRKVLGRLPHTTIKGYADHFLGPVEYGKVSINYDIRFSKKAIHRIIHTPDSVMKYVLREIFEEERSELSRTLVSEEGVDIFAYKRILDIKDGLRDIHERLPNLKRELNLQTQILSIIQAFSHPPLQLKLLDAFVILASGENILHDFLMKSSKFSEIKKTFGNKIADTHYEDIIRQGNEFEEGQREISRPKIESAVLLKESTDNPLLLNFKPASDPSHITKLYLKIQNIKWFMDVTVYENSRLHHLLGKDSFTHENGIVTLRFNQPYLNESDLFKVGEKYKIHFAYLDESEVWSDEKAIEFTYQETVEPR